MPQHAIFDLLRSGGPVDLTRLLSSDPAAARARDPQGLSVLMTALYSHRFDLAEILRGPAAPLDVFEAAAVGDAERVRELVTADSTRSRAHGVDGFMPLHLACYFGRAEAAAVLLQHGASPTAAASNPTGMHALHSAAAARRPDLVALLIESGARVDAPQQGGWTALHSAARHGDVETLRILIEAGADLELAAASGERARDLLPAEAPAEARELVEGRSSVG